MQGASLTTSDASGGQKDGGAPQSRLTAGTHPPIYGRMGPLIGDPRHTWMVCLGVLTQQTPICPATRRDAALLPAAGVARRQ